MPRAPRIVAFLCNWCAYQAADRAGQAKLEVPQTLLSVRVMCTGRVEPVSRGLNGSLTSYCLSSPVPQHDTYSQRSSTDRSMSDTSGGTAPNGLSAGGSSSESAGSAGMVTTLLTAQRSPSRCHSHTEPDRSSTLITTPTKPQAWAGSWAGR